MNTQVIQLQEYAPNPVIELGGYTPVTDYWKKIIRLGNALIVANSLHGLDAKELRKGANLTINNEIFKGEHTAEEWAEFCMAINHLLWVWHEMVENHGLEMDEVLKALNDLYYEWHDKALATLKGDDLSTYLRITD